MRRQKSVQAKLAPFFLAEGRPLVQLRAIEQIDSAWAISAIRLTRAM
jgi:hypothetical protein